MELWLGFPGVAPIAVLLALIVAPCRRMWRRTGRKSAAALLTLAAVADLFFLRRLGLESWPALDDRSLS